MRSNYNAPRHQTESGGEIAVVGMAIRTVLYKDLKHFRRASFSGDGEALPADGATAFPEASPGAAALADAGWTGSPEFLEIGAERWIEDLEAALRNPEVDFASGILCGCAVGEEGGALALKALWAAERDGDSIYGILVPAPAGDFSRCALAEICDSADGRAGEILEPLFPHRRDVAQCRLGEPRAGEPLRAFQALATAILAVHLKTIPPGRTAAGPPVNSPPLFYGCDAPRPWIHGLPQPREAVVFGSLLPRTQVLIREYTGAHPQPLERLPGGRPTELYLAAADSREELVLLLRAEAERLRGGEQPPFAEFCRARCRETRGAYRFAAIAQSARDLAGKIDSAVTSLGTRERLFAERLGYYYARTGREGATGHAKTVFLYPGFNSEYPGMLADLCMYFPGTREWFDALDRYSDTSKPLLPSDLVYPPPEGLSAEEREKLLWDLKLGGPAGLVADLAMGELVEALGVRCDAAAGHSNGENAALIAADILRYRDKSAVLDMVARITLHYREGEQRHRSYLGHFLLVSGVEERELRALVDASGGKLRPAMENCVNQVVLYAAEAGEELAGKIRTLGGVCIVRPTERPYHTPLFEEHAGLLKDFYRKANVGEGIRPVYSTSTTEPFPSDPEGIRQLALRQWIRAVKFRQTVERLYEEGVRCFIETGPDATITAFVKDTLRGKEHVAIASNVPYRSGWEQLQHLAARLFVEGYEIRPEFFFEARGLADDRETAPARDTELSQGVTIPVRAAETGNGLLPEAVRESAIASHFELMDRFLESQRSVMSSMVALLKSGGLGDVPDVTPDVTFDAPVAAACEAPAVPHRPGSRTAAAPAPRQWRLTGDILERGENRYYAERLFDVSQDRFLLDHALGRRISDCHSELIPLPIVPFTISMTILAEAACRLAEGKHCLALTDIRGSRWLAADRGTLRLGIEAQRENGGPDTEEVRVRLYEIDRDSGRRYLAFEGSALMGARYPERPAPMPVRSEDIRQAQVPVEFFYSYCTYNGPVFQGIRQVLEFDESTIVSDLQVPPTERFRADGADPGFEIPGALLDSVGQLSGYWLVEQGIRDFGIFPFRCARYSQFAEAPRPGARFRSNCSIRRHAHIVTCSFDFLDDAGRVFARIEDMELRFYDNPWVRRFFVAHDPEDMFTTPDSESGPMVDGTEAIARRIDTLPGEFLHQSWNIWSRALAHLILNSRELDAWYRLPARDAAASQILLERLVAKDAVRVWARRELMEELLPADIEVTSADEGRVRAHSPLIPPAVTVPLISVRSVGEGAVAILGGAAPETAAEYSAAAGAAAFDGFRQTANV